VNTSPGHKSPAPAKLGSPLRLAGAALAIAIGLVALWQAGVIFAPEDVTITDAGGRTVELHPADVSVATPPSGNRTVGLNEGNLAPDFEFSAFDGRRMRLSDFRGRPVFLNFWASWCGPCRAEMPLMEVVLRRYQADGLAVLGVNNGERIQAAERFLERLDVQLTAYAYDPAADVARLYGIPGLPTSVFIDAEGVITRVYALALSEELMEEAVRLTIAGYGTAGD
jgi:thiol-disulfide isomerase/thioredoxin